MVEICPRCGMELTKMKDYNDDGRTWKGTYYMCKSQFGCGLKCNYSTINR